VFNYIELTESLKGLPQQKVIQMAAMGGNPMEKTLAVGELQRRQQMMMKAQANMAKPNQTIADQVVGQSAGLGSMVPMMQPQGAPQAAPPMAPQQLGGGAQSMGAAPPQQDMAPQGAPMKDGGLVGLKMDGGGEVPPIRVAPTAPAVRGEQPMSVEDQIRALVARRLAASEIAPPTIEEQVARYNHLAGDRLPGLEEAIARNAKTDTPDQATQLNEMLASFGGHVAAGHSPNFLTNLGDAAGAMADSLHNNRLERIAANRQNVQDQMGLAQLAERGVAGGLGLNQVDSHSQDEALSQSMQGLGALLNSDTQRSVASMYANRAGGGRGGQSNAFRAATAVYHEANLNVRSLEHAISTAQAAGQTRNQIAPLQEQYDAAVQARTAAEAELRRISMLESLGVADDSADTGGGLGDLGGAGGSGNPPPPASQETGDAPPPAVAQPSSGSPSLYDELFRTVFGGNQRMAPVAPGVRPSAQANVDRQRNIPNNPAELPVRTR